MSASGICQTRWREPVRRFSRTEYCSSNTAYDWQRATISALIHAASSAWLDCHGAGVT
jgi:hypothetical protein